jgi:thymidylate synthase
MKNVDEIYLGLMRDIELNGVDKTDRTGTGTRSVFGRQLRYDLSEGKVPLLTTKKIFTRSFVHETLWFIDGNTDIKYLKENNVSIWDSWVNPKTAKYDDQGELVSGDIGPGYGKQWRRWEDTRIIPLVDWRKNEHAFKERGFEFKGNLGSDEVVIKREIDQLALIVRMLRETPDSRRIILSAWNVAELDEMRLPPCFLKGNKVNTPTGYRNIEDLEVGDEVYSGTGVVRKVLQKFTTPYSGELVLFKTAYMSVPITTTPNHPFLVKDKGWVDAGKLEKGDYVAINRTKSHKNHTHTWVRELGWSGQTREDTVECTLDDYYTFGYYMGNGWSSQSDHRISIAIPHDKLDYILPKLRKTIKISRKPGNSETVSTYETHSKKWIELFRTFGHKAPNKVIPTWVLNSTLDAKKAFIEGFLDADGYRINENNFLVTTTSPHIAYGLQRLMAELEIPCGVGLQHRPKTTVIEGRTVNQNDTYSLRCSWNPDSNKNGNVFFDNDYLWVKVAKIKNLTTENNFVYNIAVEEEHTYTVNNIVNHNCHTLSQWYTEPMTIEEVFEEAGIDDLSLDTKSGREGIYREGSSVVVCVTGEEPSGEELVLKVVEHLNLPTHRLSCQLYQR